MSVLFLSPHLDDVVLSCPGQVLAEVSAGHEVVIATLFSHGSPAHAERRAHDHDACARLGAANVHLGLVDAPERRGHRAAYFPLIFEARPRDESDLGMVTTAIEPLVRSAERAYAPLGIGGHVDHRLTFEAAAALGVETFYEDQPYASVELAREVRFSNLGAVVDGALAVDMPRYLASLANAHYFLRYTTPEDRARCLDAHREMTSARPPEARSAFRPCGRELTAEQRRKARAAIACYTTETASVLGARVEARSNEQLWQRFDLA